MIPVKIRHFTARAFSTIFAFGLFILLLPVTVGLTLIMLLFSLLTLATLRSQLEKKSATSMDQKSHTTRKQTAENLRKPPIEGSYKVID